jgi:hypothetical protein
VILPEIASGAAGELTGLRAACDTAVARLLAVDPAIVLVIGPGPALERYCAGAGGSLAGYGVDVVIGLRGPVRPGPAAMPLSVTIGAWLLDRAGWPGDRRALAVPAAASGAELAALAAELRGIERLGLLVLGDGTARRSEKAPGYLDPRAARYDAAVAAALGAADAAALASLDPALGADLLAAGVPAWRLAGLVAAGLPLRGDLLHDAAPYGVGYFVATWLP